MTEFLYKPSQEENEPEKATIGVKFSNNIILLESFLKQKNIPYKPEDLEDTPMGIGLVIRRANER